ncbi:MAG: MiaB/RimO family radical SAM methylthiotransferase [Planctomycetota bacterium]|jgi:threonylcarbamoyladenosine tRNA methylthiotransferase MtaB
MRYRITTLGCRVNHAEAREMESVLLDRGLVRAAGGEPADLEVIHTCGITATAAGKSRHAIRRAARRSLDDKLPGRDLHQAFPAGVTWSPQIIVTGCLGSTDPQDAVRLAGGRQHVVTHEAEDDSALTERFARRVDHWLATRQAYVSLRNHPPGSCRQTTRPLPIVTRRFSATPRVAGGCHVRAELKIQDGCDARCTYCVIPAVRRTLRSKEIRDTVSEARHLVNLGHREIVLTGVFIGAYGCETALRRRQARTRNEPLADLLDAVAAVDGLQRLRLSSLEPGDVTEQLLDAVVANRPVVVPHLHLPLQSGSDAILRRMNRQYAVGDYLEMIGRVNAALTTPDGLPPALTTDIICGFPGETGEDFARTVDVARRVGYLHMHVFPFSPRPGTAAARWRDRFVAPAVAKARVRRLIALEDDPEQGLSIRYRRRLRGRTVRVIVEKPDRSDPTLMTGRCDHYVLIRLRTSRPRGALVHAKITEVNPQRTLGRVVAADIPLPVATFS